MLFVDDDGVAVTEGPMTYDATQQIFHGPSDGLYEASEGMEKWYTENTTENFHFVIP